MLITKSGFKPIVEYNRGDRLALDVSTLGNSAYVHQTDGSQIGLHYWDGTQWNYIPSVPSI